VSVSIGIVKLALNACKIVVIVVDAVWSSKIRAFNIKRRVADAVALGPLLVTFNAGERAGASRTAGASVFMGSDVACGRSVYRHYEEAETDHIEQSSLRSRSGICGGSDEV